MMAAPLPAKEEERLASLRALGLLGTPAEERFDRLVRMAARLLDAPVCLISFIEKDEEVVKASAGFGRTVIPRGISLGAHAILRYEPFVLVDATLDGRFKRNPMVAGEPRIRFYAAHPLQTVDGHRVGVLSVIDRRPRALSDLQQQVLLDLVALAENEINLGETFRALEQLRRKEAELAALKSQAEEAAALKSGFLSAMSHEIRTPLHGVIGMTSLLMGTKLSDEQQDYVEAIRSSGDSLLALVNDILDLSDLEAGRIAFEHQPFDVRHCVEEVLAAQTPREEVELLYRVDPSVPVLVFGDVSRVRQILYNLVSYAVEYTERGEVEAVVDANRLEEGGWELAFTVRDTGIGLSEEIQAKLFRQFVPADFTSPRKFGGTGLSLAICRMLAEAMGDRLTVESRVGEGTSICFTLRTDAAENPPQEHAAGLDRKRIALLAPHPGVRSMLARMLQELGASAVLFHSARDLVEGCLNSRTDAILVDAAFPGADKISAAMHEKGIRAPLILLAHTAIPHAFAVEAGFSAGLAKPVRRSELVERLQQAWRGKSDPVDAKASGDNDRNSARLAGLSVLLAEDNTVNQKIGVKMLKQLGMAVEVASNGFEVLEWLNRGRFDVILMDVEMPGMDGLEATRKIHERWIREHRPRILAMTANAQQGDRERCLAAGMDGYVSKPVKLHELKVAIESVLYVDRPVVDLSIVQNLRQLEDGGDLFRELVDIYLEDTPSQISDCTAAIGEQDAKRAMRAAHTLRGASASFGAMRVQQVCKELERAAADGDFAVAGRLSQRLESEFEMARTTLLKMKDEV